MINLLGLCFGLDAILIKEEECKLLLFDLPETIFEDAIRLFVTKIGEDLPL